MTGASNVIQDQEGQKKPWSPSLVRSVKKHSEENDPLINYITFMITKSFVSQNNRLHNQCPSAIYPSRNQCLFRKTAFGTNCLSTPHHLMMNHSKSSPLNTQNDGQFLSNSGGG